MIIRCKNPNCKHEYQDTKYGVGNRVMNPTRQTHGDKVVYRCTVCLTEQTESEALKQDKS